MLLRDSRNHWTRLAPSLFSVACLVACSTEGITQAEYGQAEQATLQELSDLGIIDLDEDGNPVTPQTVSGIPVPDAPEFRWSLITLDVGGGRTELEVLEPDPNWISNHFLTATLANEDQTLAAFIDCSHVSWAIELTGINSMTLGLMVLDQTDPDCVNNAPEGAVRSVLADYTTIVIEPADEGEIHISNGNGSSLFFAPAGLDLSE